MCLILFAAGAHPRFPLIVAANRDEAYDLRSLRRVGVWDLSRSLPGFAVAGLTYAPRDDRIYLVGELSGSTSLSASSAGIGTKVIGPATSVVALDPRKGAPVWIRPVPSAASSASRSSCSGSSCWYGCSSSGPAR